MVVESSNHPLITRPVGACATRATGHGSVGHAWSGPFLAQTTGIRLHGAMRFQAIRGAVIPHGCRRLLPIGVVCCRLRITLGGLEVPSSNLGAPIEERAGNQPFLRSGGNPFGYQLVTKAVAIA